MPLTILNRCEMITGSYTGDGIDDRDIDVGVDLSTKTFIHIMIKGDVGGASAEYVTGVAIGSSIRSYGDVIVNAIQDINSTGFEIGTVGEVNTNTETYYYVVYYQE